jgi:hypothetical protein
MGFSLSFLNAKQDAEDLFVLAAWGIDANLEATTAPPRALRIT